MQNQLQDELEKIAKLRRIKNYKNMSKKELLIALLKSEQSLAEVYNKVKEKKVEESILIIMTRIMKGYGI